MNEVLELGRECGLVYGLMWESAFKDSDGEFGGTTSWSVKGLTNKCDEPHNGNSGFEEVDGCWVYSAFV